MGHDPFDVLLVEDNAGDVVLTRETLAMNHVVRQLHVARDGAQALRFLRREPPYEDAATPDLILLDLNLPGMSGHDILQILKSDPSLRAIPVVVLTTSSAREDVQRAYALHANAYMTKPVRIEQFVAAMEAVKAFWFGAARLPTKNGD